MLEVTGYEKMAMLDLKSSERDAIYERMKELENYFLRLEQIDTENVQPLVSVLDIKNVLREDVSFKRISRDEMLENAPEQWDGYISVPGTLE